MVAQDLMEEQDDKGKKQLVDYIVKLEDRGRAKGKDHLEELGDMVSEAEDYMGELGVKGKAVDARVEYQSDEELQVAYVGGNE